MKKQFAQLSKAEREKVESDYHSLQSEDLDKLMSQAKPQAANANHRSSARSRSKRKNKAPEKKRAA